MEEPQLGAGVLGVACCECFIALGRETLYGPSLPLGTVLYKGDRNQYWPCKESAGLIIPLVSLWKLSEREATLLQLMAFKGVEDV